MLLSRILPIGVGIAIVAYVLIGGSAETSQTFDVPTASVIERLAQSHRVVNGTGLGSLTIGGDAFASGNAVKIGVTRAGNPLTLWCTANVEALSVESSRVALDCAQDRTTRTATEQTMVRFGGEALAIVVSEHIAATVAQHPYDIDHVANEMLVFVSRHGPVMAAAMLPPSPARSDTSAAR